MNNPKQNPLQEPVPVNPIREPMFPQEYPYSPDRRPAPSPQIHPAEPQVVPQKQPSPF